VKNHFAVFIYFADLFIAFLLRSTARPGDNLSGAPNGVIVGLELIGSDAGK